MSLHTAGEVMCPAGYEKTQLGTSHSTEVVQRHQKIDEIETSAELASSLSSILHRHRQCCYY